MRAPSRRNPEPQHPETLHQQQQSPLLRVPCAACAAASVTNHHHHHHLLARLQAASADCWCQQPAVQTSNGMDQPQDPLAEQALEGVSARGEGSGLGWSLRRAVLPGVVRSAQAVGQVFPALPPPQRRRPRSVSPLALGRLGRLLMGLLVAVGVLLVVAVGVLLLLLLLL